MPANGVAGQASDAEKERAERKSEKRRRRQVRIVALVLVTIIAVIVVVAYIALESSTDPAAMSKGVCTIIILIGGVIAFELLMKPQLALYDPDRFDAMDDGEGDGEKREGEAAGEKEKGKEDDRERPPA